MNAPTWIEQALHHASQHFAGGARRFATEPHSVAIIAEHLLERLPMPAIQIAIEETARSVVSITVRAAISNREPNEDITAATIAERASVAIVRLIADPNLGDPVNDRQTYLEVSAALDRCGAPRSDLRRRPLTLAERVCALGAQRFGAAP